MFNNINDNGSIFYSQFDNQTNVINLAKLRAASKNYGSAASGLYIDSSEISSNAINLYQKDCDIQKFNKIALNNLSDEDYTQQIQSLFSDNFTDPFGDDILSDLSTNSKLLEDLGL